MRNITKTFGPVVANDKVWLDIYKGEILALLGENGSGKTTLMNMLAGIYFPDSGRIIINGQEVTIRSPRDAFDLHIGMIHQHFKLVDVLTAAENIVLGLNESRLVDLKGVRTAVKDICDRYGFVVDPDKKVYDMSHPKGNSRNDDRAAQILLRHAPEQKAPENQLLHVAGNCHVDHHQQ